MNKNDSIRELQNLSLQVVIEHLSSAKSSNFSFIEKDKEKLLKMLSRFKADEVKTRHVKFLSLKKLLSMGIFFLSYPGSNTPIINNHDDHNIHALLDIILSKRELKIHWINENVSQKVKFEILELLAIIIRA